MTTATETSTAPRFRVSALLVFLILAFVLSWYPWVLALLPHTASGLNPVGLLVAALIASALGVGWRGPREILLGIVRVRVPFTRWIAAFLIPIGIVATAVALAMVLGIGVKMQRPNWSDARSIHHWISVRRTRRRGRMARLPSAISAAEAASCHRNADRRCHLGHLASPTMGKRVRMEYCARVSRQPLRGLIYPELAL